MGQTFHISVNIPKDNEGMIGRECLKCEKYFKLKPGTGLPTNHCHCPYCEYDGNADTFWTPQQLEYARSVAKNHAYDSIIRPTIDNLLKPFKDLERKTRHDPFLKVTVTTPVTRKSPYPVHYFSEEDLETKLTCDNCGLVFSIYGVFGRCPDCKDYNAFQIYQKSLELLRKQLHLLTTPEIPADIKFNSLAHILSGCVSAFDGLGKELRLRKPSKYPDRPKNLFQNLGALDHVLNNLISNSHANFPLLGTMFQVRHLFEHNMGVVDDDFIIKVPRLHYMKGRKYPLTEPEILQLIEGMLELGVIIEIDFKK